MKAFFTKSVCAIVGLAAKEKTRYALNSVKVEVCEGETRFIATNGRYLGIIESKNNLVNDDRKSEAGETIAPLEAFKDSASDYPTQSAISRKPATGYKQIQTPGAAEGDLEPTAYDVSVTGSDKSQNETKRIYRNIEGTYPKFDGVIPEDAAKATVYLDAKLLKVVADSLVKFRTDESDQPIVKLEIRDETTAIVFETENLGELQTMKVILMPCDRMQR